MRAITGAMYNESASPLFKITGILKVSDMLQVSMLQYMYIFVDYDWPAPLWGGGGVYTPLNSPRLN